MSDFAELRDRMVRRQIEARGISDAAILDAFRSVPREVFVSPDYARDAYDDHPLPIEAGQTVSQPYIVALMIAAAEIGPNDRVLEVGAGSGYAARGGRRLAQGQRGPHDQGDRDHGADQQQRRRAHDNLRGDVVVRRRARGVQRPAPGGRNLPVGDFMEHHAGLRARTDGRAVP